MESIGISGLHRLFISQANINLIIENYKDFDRVCWKKFCNDIDEVFQTKNLDELPYSIVQSPSEEFQVLLRQGQEDWTCQPMDVRELAEATILKVKNYIKRRSLPIHQFFRGYDRCKCNDYTLIHLIPINFFKGHTTFMSAKVNSTEFWQQLEFYCPRKKLVLCRKDIVMIWDSITGDCWKMLKNLKVVVHQM